MKDILNINAHLKYVEFILHTFDNGADELTLGQLRNQFQEKFGTMHPLLNQNFGIYRLIPLVLIKEEYKNQKKELSGDVAKIKIIRDAIAHHSFSIDESGYVFQNDKGKISFTYQQFTAFLHRVENEFYHRNG
ncbi:MAG: hypothetical protein V6Z89_11920 [Desulfobacter sp.]